MITLIAPFLFMGAKGKLQNQQKHEQDNSREDGAPLSFPAETSEPELESRAMKNKQTERKSRSGFGLTRHLIGGVLCLAVISLICSSAPGQNLFVSSFAAGGNIYEFTPDGVRSTFVSGLSYPGALAFDRNGNLFVAVDGGIILKFTQDGLRTTFASGLDRPIDLAFDSAGNLFVTTGDRDDDGFPINGSGKIHKLTPNGVRTTFASGLDLPTALAFNSAGNLFVANVSNSISGTIYKFTPAGGRTTFASGLTNPEAVAVDNAGNLFVSAGIVGESTGLIYKFTPNGNRSTFALGFSPFAPLAFDSAGNLFVSDFGGNIYKFTRSGVRSTFASGVSGFLAFGKPSPPAPTDFNNDGKPDYLLYNSSTRQTVIWYLNSNIFIGSALGPTVPAGWQPVGVADFNRDGHPDYLLFNEATRGTVIWYMNNNVHMPNRCAARSLVQQQIIRVAVAIKIRHTHGTNQPEVGPSAEPMKMLLFRTIDGLARAQIVEEMIRLPVVVKVSCAGEARFPKARNPLTPEAKFSVLRSE